MLSKTLIATGLALGLATGLLSRPAAAREELVVYGTTAASDAPAARQRLRAEIRTYVRALNEELKLGLERELKRSTAPKLQLASSEVPIRG